jgi:autotransporter-associated beta strand protein
VGDNSIAIMVVSAFLTYIASVGGTALISGWQNLEISGIFTRSLNTVATTTAATFTGNGGWAAYGANRVVNLGGASDTISWFTAGTGLNNKRLILGASTATHMGTLQNPLDLDTTPCTVQVDDGAAVVDATLSGVLTDWGGLTKTGAGTLQLTAANTYYGDTVISAGMDRLNINGTLDVQANSGNLFTVMLVSMATTTTPGLVPDFNGSTNYTWVIAAASGGILNFDASKFAIDATRLGMPSRARSAWPSRATTWWSITRRRRRRP